MKQRQKARKIVEKDPSTQNKREYNKLTAKVRHLTKSAKQEAWKNNCKKLDPNKEGHKTCRLLNNLEGKGKQKNSTNTLQMSTNKREETRLTAIYGDQLRKTTLLRDINIWHLKHHLIWQNLTQR